MELLVVNHSVEIKIVGFIRELNKKFTNKILTGCDTWAE